MRFSCANGTFFVAGGLVWGLRSSVSSFSEQPFLCFTLEMRAFWLSVTSVWRTPSLFWLLTCFHLWVCVLPFLLLLGWRKFLMSVVHRPNPKSLLISIASVLLSIRIYIAWHSPWTKLFVTAELFQRWWSDWMWWVLVAIGLHPYALNLYDRTA